MGKHAANISTWSIGSENKMFESCSAPSTRWEEASCSFQSSAKTIQTAPVLQTQQSVTAVLVGMEAQAFQASMIPLKSAAFKAAPPIKPPSTSTFEKISLALEGLQLPP